MTTDRRRYYRIEDRALISYRVIADDSLLEERRFDFLHEVKATNVQAALMGIDRRLHDVLDAVRLESKPAAEALELMNRKIGLIERVVASINQGDDARQCREQQPLDVSISGGGIAFCTSESVGVDLGIAIELTLLPSHHSMRIIGRVIDCRENEDGQFDVAFEFEEMLDEDRDFLVQHILRKQSAALRVQRSSSRHHAA